MFGNPIFYLLQHYYCICFANIYYLPLEPVSLGCYEEIAVTGTSFPASWRWPVVVCVWNLYPKTSAQTGLRYSVVYSCQVVYILVGHMTFFLRMFQPDILFHQNQRFCQQESQARKYSICMALRTCAGLSPKFTLFWPIEAHKVT